MAVNTMLPMEPTKWNLQIGGVGRMLRWHWFRLIRTWKEQYYSA